MKKLIKILVLALTLIINVSYAQNNCPSLGPDQYLPCGQTQTTLNANIGTCIPSTVSPNLTTSYSVVSIPFAPSPTVGSTAVVMSDDSGTGALPIGFTFCFYGNTYTQFYIGSNGWISFSPAQPTGFVSAPIPNIGFVPKNCIMGPWQDWHPGIAGGPYIRYQTLGTAPCRRLVVSWNQCPMFSCTTTKGTFQIIIYESTNLIENHLTSKPNCMQWAGGTATEGIHNIPGTNAVTVPGRNSTAWTATNDAWRWVPTGALVTPTLTWFQVGNPIAIGTGSTIVVTPAVTGTSYTCKYQYGQCNAGFEVCSAMPGNSPDTVFVMPLTAIIPTITAPTCIGGPTQISCAPNTPTNNYSWSGPNIVGPNNSPTITINGPGNYICTITSTAAACNGTAMVTVAQIPTISIVASSNTLCALNTNGSLNSVSLTASGAPNYTWTGATNLVNTYTSNVQPFISYSPTSNSGIGTATIIGSNGTCSSTTIYTLLIIPNPTISVTSPSVCQGNTVTIVANNATSYTWSPSNTLSSNTGSSVVANTNTNTTTAYSVIGTSLGCNSNTEISIVTIVANPTVMVAPVVNTICAGSNINLTATGATNYTWTPNNSLNVPNGPSVNASPLITTNYTVIGEQSTCTTTAVYQVSVIPLPIILVSPQTATICQYSSVNLYLNGASNYVWSPAAGLNTTSGSQVTASPNNTTIYNINGTNGICSAQGSATVYVVPFPNVNLSTTNNKICRNSSTMLSASGASNYIWSPALSLSSATTSAVQANPIVTTQYTLTGYNYLGDKVCGVTHMILIEVVPNVTVNISNDLEICLGQSAQLLSEGGPTYTWTPSNGLSNTSIKNPVATPTISTMYNVNISYYGNCGANANVYVKVNPNPSVTAGEDFTVNLDEPAFLNASGSGTLTWLYGDGIYCKPCPNSQIFPKSSGCYVIESINIHGCKSTDEVCVNVTANYNLFIPSSFTPNGDGINDTFLTYGTGITKFDLSIFDRWGEELFKTNDQLKGWDGTYKSQLSKTDIYVYKISYTGLDGKTHTKTGHVTLLK
jgi:gliding motility-associated-like protein